MFTSARLLPFRLLLSACILCLSVPATSLAAEYVTVIKDGVNVRAEPSTKGEVFWEVFKDFPLKVIQRKGDWVKAEDFEGDTVFPEIDKTIWKEASNTFREKDENHDYEFSFITYVKR